MVIHDPSSAFALLKLTLELEKKLLYLSRRYIKDYPRSALNLPVVVRGWILEIVRDTIGRSSDLASDTSAAEANPA
ncbi:hypothetical protein Aduo_012996 [Ancylostoma duodenale]